jgi:hypothetical protein
MIWNEVRISETDAEILRVEEEIRRTCAGMLGSPECTAVQARGAELLEQQGRENTARAISWAFVGTGAASLVSGLVLWLLSRSEDEIDRAAHAGLDVVPLSGGALLRARLTMD